MQHIRNDHYTIPRIFTNKFRTIPRFFTRIHKKSQEALSYFLAFQVSHIPMGCKKLIFVVLPNENPYGITLTIPVGKHVRLNYKSLFFQHPIGMHHNSQT